MNQVRLDVSDGIATITLNRPQALNAFTPQMADELIESFDVCDQSDEVRATVLTGAGAAFCVGMDLALASAGAQSPDEPIEAGLFRDPGGVVALRMLAMSKPIIAAINGPAIGIGATLPLAADLRIAWHGARFGFVFTRRGLVPESCSSWLLPRLVSMQRALEWMISGRVFTAEEALSGGLVRSIHDLHELNLAATTLARELVRETAPVSVAYTRRLLWQMLQADSPLEAHHAESRALESRMRSHDGREGIQAFLDKRPAAFQELVSVTLPELQEFSDSSQVEHQSAEKGT